MKKCPLLALSGHRAHADECQPLGGNADIAINDIMSASDPNRILASPMFSSVEALPTFFFSVERLMDGDSFGWDNTQRVRARISAGIL